MAAAQVTAEEVRGRVAAATAAAAAAAEEGGGRLAAEAAVAAELPENQPSMRNRETAISTAFW